MQPLPAQQLGAARRRRPSRILIAAALFTGHHDTRYSRWPVAPTRALHVAFTAITIRRRQYQFCALFISPHCAFRLFDIEDIAFSYALRHAAYREFVNMGDTAMPYFTRLIVLASLPRRAESLSLELFALYNQSCQQQR